MNYEEIKDIEFKMYENYLEGLKSEGLLEKFKYAFDLLWIPISYYTFQLYFFNLALDHILITLRCLIQIPFDIIKDDELNNLEKILASVLTVLICSLLLITQIVSFFLSIITRPVATAYYLFKSKEESGDNLHKYDIDFLLN